MHMSYTEVGRYAEIRTLAPAAHLKIRWRRLILGNGATSRGVSKKSAPLPSFMPIYFNNFTVMNARLICGDVPHILDSPITRGGNELRSGVPCPARMVPCTDTASLS